MSIFARLDNEISDELIEAIENDTKLDYQIAPPGDHRQNPTEGAIKHVKAHFKSVRACADKTFKENQDRKNQEQQADRHHAVAVVSGMKHDMQNLQQSYEDLKMQDDQSTKTTEVIEQFERRERKGGESS